MSPVFSKMYRKNVNILRFLGDLDKLSVFPAFMYHPSHQGCGGHFLLFTGNRKKLDLSVERNPVNLESLQVGKTDVSRMLRAFSEIQSLPTRDNA